MVPKSLCRNLWGRRASSSEGHPSPFEMPYVERVPPQAAPSWNGRRPKVPSALTLYYELRGADGDLAEVQLRCVPRDAAVTFRMSGDGFDLDPEYSFLPESASDGSLSSEPEGGAALPPRDGSSTLDGVSGLATAPARVRGSAVSREHRSRTRSPVNDTDRR